MNDLYQTRRIICTTDWLAHELHPFLRRLDVDAEERDEVLIRIEPEDPGYARVYVYHRDAPHSQSLLSRVLMWLAARL